jgi:hypothetical protein
VNTYLEAIYDEASKGYLTRLQKQEEKNRIALMKSGMKSKDEGIQ